MNMFLWIKYFTDVLFEEYNALLIMVIIFARDSIFVLKHHDLKHIGKERVYLGLQLWCHTPSPREVKAGTYGRN